jgi:hypothetical protein
VLECAGARYEWNNEWEKEVVVRIQNLHKSREIDAHPCSSRLGTTNIVRFHKAHSLTPFSSFETTLVRGIQPQIPGTPRKWSKFASPTFLLAPPRLDTRIAEGSVSRILRRTQPSQTRISTVDLYPRSGSSRDD